MTCHWCICGSLVVDKWGGSCVVAKTYMQTFIIGI